MGYPDTPWDEGDVLLSDELNALVLTVTGSRSDLDSLTNQVGVNEASLDKAWDNLAVLDAYLRLYPHYQWAVDGSWAHRTNGQVEDYTGSPRLCCENEIVTLNYTVSMGSKGGNIWNFNPLTYGANNRHNYAPSPGWGWCIYLSASMDHGTMHPVIQFPTSSGNMWFDNSVTTPGFRTGYFYCSSQWGTGGFDGTAGFRCHSMVRHGHTATVLEPKLAAQMSRTEVADAYDEEWDRRLEGMKGVIEWQAALPVLGPGEEPEWAEPDPVVHEWNADDPVLAVGQDPEHYDRAIAYLEDQSNPYPYFFLADRQRAEAKAGKSKRRKS